MHKDDEDTLSVPSSLLFARSSCSSFQSGEEREREKDGKEQATEIWAYCTSFHVQFWIVVQRNFYKGRRKEKKGEQKKEEKEKKIGKLRPSSLLFFSFLIPEIESEKKSKENK